MEDAGKALLLITGMGDLRPATETEAEKMPSQQTPSGGPFHLI